VAATVSVGAKEAADWQQKRRGEEEEEEED